MMLFEASSQLANSVVIMTLICSAFGHGFLAISDILVSREANETLDVALPLHRGRVQHVAGQAQAAGVCQKMILLGSRTLVQFAGSVLLARIAIERIKELSENGVRRINLQSVLDSLGLTKAELDDLSIIYHHSAGGQLHREWHRAEVRDQVVYAGSGAWDFLENTEVDISEQGSAGVDFKARWLMPLFNTLASEMMSRDNLGYAYGGWFEVAELDPITGDIYKIPYLVKVWKKEGSDRLVASLPTIFSSYLDEDLLICTVLQEAEPPETSLHVVRPVDRRGLLPSHMPTIDQMVLPHTLQCHFIFENDPAKARTIIESRTAPRFRLMHESGGIAAEMDHEFVDALLDAPRESLVSRTRKRYS